MGWWYKELIRPLLFRFDSERVHHFALDCAEKVSGVPFINGAISKLIGGKCIADSGLRVDVAGLSFPNPIGLAAGFDKDGRACKALAALGFGHLEIGTVTTEVQPGNPVPRVWRLPARDALVNALGFPSSGVAEVLRRVAALRAQEGALGGALLGINIGKSKITSLDDAPAEYGSLLRAVAPYADYVTVNVSSPNTPELRRLQEKERLIRIFSELSSASSVPVFVKIAPDLSFQDLDEVLESVECGGISGVIATNTTIDKSKFPEAVDLPGGLSGAPLHPRALEVVGYIAKRTEGKLPIMGVGGVRSSREVLAFIGAGAAMAQVYTGLVYEGPWLVRKICGDLEAYIKKVGVKSISELRGATQNELFGGSKC